MMGKLLLDCNGKHKVVPQVGVSATHVESRPKDEFVGFSSM